MRPERSHGLARARGALFDCGLAVVWRGVAVRNGRLRLGRRAQATPAGADPAPRDGIFLGIPSGSPPSSGGLDAGPGRGLGFGNVGILNWPPGALPGSNTSAIHHIPFICLFRQAGRARLFTAIPGANGAAPRASRPRQTSPDRAVRGWSKLTAPATSPGAFIPNRLNIFFAITDNYSDIRFANRASSRFHGGHADQALGGHALDVLRTVAGPVHAPLPDQ